MRRFAAAVASAPARDPRLRTAIIPEEPSDPLFVALAEPRVGNRISLEHWCILRGYPQGLEHILSDAVKGFIQKRVLLKFLNRLPASLPAGFQRLGFDERYGKFYAARVIDHVRTAISEVGGGSLENQQALHHLLEDWIARQLF